MGVNGDYSEFQFLSVLENLGVHSIVFVRRPLFVLIFVFFLYIVGGIAFFSLFSFLFWELIFIQDIRISSQSSMTRFVCCTKH